MSVLSSVLRKGLEDACVRGRRAADAACRAALGSLGVIDRLVPAHLGEADRVLRRGLRAKSRQLGDEPESIELLVSECAFEQWHRLLFTRFLAENDLLIHPQYRAPVTLSECEDLAAEFGEPDGWAVAGQFAAEILPGIFRLEDPCVRLRLAPEGRLELERIVASLPAEVFIADDALGWVYQYWQREKKDEVNASERKIGGADLGPVTQLFTENYMVRFLLENSLGAWWAARHPDSPLLKEWVFLRFDHDSGPTVGAFQGWPARAAEVTVMDPCCGSGHFLVEAFSMFWKMRAEEEGLGPVAAQDAVLTDNLFGLELDPRCMQIAMFAVALTAWKAGGGWRELPIPNIACSGIPVKAPVEEWKALAGGDGRLENALVRLHILFRDADTLGSLIDPKRAAEISDSTQLQSSFEDVDWDDIAPLLTTALTRETDDPATAVLGADAAGIARAADYLSRHYTLVATNVPYLKRGSQATILRNYVDTRHGLAAADIATAMLDRWRRAASTAASVQPSSWTYQSAYRSFRRELLETRWPTMLAALGAGAFESITGEVVNVCLLVGGQHTAHLRLIDASEGIGPVGKAALMVTAVLRLVGQSDVLKSEDFRIVLDQEWNYGASQLADFAEGLIGFQSGDNPRYRRQNWEVNDSRIWRPLQSTFDSIAMSQAGCDEVIYWANDGACYAAESGARMQGTSAWGHPGVAVSLMGDLRTCPYDGYIHDNSTGVVRPRDESDLPAIWSFMKSDVYASLVHQIDRSLKVAASSLVKVPFDADHWRATAASEFPRGLPKPYSNDPTQWLFEGRPEVASEPLQVAMGRLVGYRWPEQSESDDLDGFADDDGIVCLPSVRGERSALERLQELLAQSFGSAWTPSRVSELLSGSGSSKRDLETWLRDDFFKAHCQVFKNRPFIWHVWDGRKDGFSALVNYHRLDRALLERLAYAYVGDWIERQAAGAREDVAGAEERLAAAQGLQRRLQLILDGEPPYDIYIRWKSLAEQAIGWEPDVNDGVRLNVRPFVEAGVLRAKFNVKWDKDRGKNPEGNERHNDLHYTRAAKEAARKGHGI